MSTMALEVVSPATIYSAARPTVWDLRGARTVVRIVGHLLVDSIGSFILGKLNTRLERDVLTMRGLCSVMSRRDSVLVDPNLEANRLLSELDVKVLRLRDVAQQAMATTSLKRTDTEVRRTVDICIALHEVLVKLRQAIVDHDAAVVGASDEMRRLMADLQRTDDVPAERYAELVNLLRKAPQFADEDKRGDPAPL